MTFKEEQDVIKMIGQVLFVQDLGKFLIATNSEYQSHTFRKLYLSNELVLFFFFSNNDRLLAPTTYIFFASALPVIAFGAQLNRDTGSSSLSIFSNSHVTKYRIATISFTVKCINVY